MLIVNKDQRDLVRYPIPGVNGYSINKQLDIFDANGRKACVCMNPNSYPSVSVDTKNINVHTLVARTFIPQPESTETLEVNHKDGDKSNYAINNLEWVTRSGNLIHAYKNNLRSDNIRVQAKDLRDGVVLEFYSLSEAARHFKLRPESLSWYFFPENRPKLIQSFYIVRKLNEEWPSYNDSDIGEFSKNSQRPIMVRDLDKKNMVVYGNLKEAAIAINSTQGAITQFLRRHKDRAYRDRYVIKPVANMFEYLKLDPSIIVKLDKKPSNRNLYSLPTPITVIDAVTGEQTSWPSSQAFSDHLGVKKNTFQKAVWKNGYWKNYKVEYNS